jgi:hypothetical protein
MLSTLKELKKSKDESTPFRAAPVTNIILNREESGTGGLGFGYPK